MDNMINTNNLISIIIPVYNVEPYLNKCLDSILQQSYLNIEIILVNDGSTDQSGQIIEKYCRMDSRFIAIHKSNGGLSDARNAGIDIAKGEFIVFVDSDDYVHYQYVEILYKTMCRYNADIAVCEELRVNDNISGNTFLNIQDTYQIECYSAIEAMKFWYTSTFKAATCAWGKIYKKALFERERFDVGILHEDEFIMHRLFNKSSRVVYIWAQLYFHYLRPNSITGSANYSLQRLDILSACDNRADLFHKLGDEELVLLHAQWYIDVILGCIAELSQNYIGPDKQAALQMLKKKLNTLCINTPITFKQRLKILFCQTNTTAYSKFYMHWKGRA